MFRRPRGFGRYVSPWREMERMRREMNRLFAGWPTTTGRIGYAPSYPAMNVWADEDAAVVTAELPGVEPDDIDISVVGDTLRLSGNREPVQLEEGQTYHRRERNYGRFTRSFQLPFEIESEGVEARFQKGVLHISLPRAERDRPRRITVKTG